MRVENVDDEMASNGAAVEEVARPKFFFIHVMKTGGTSFAFHLLRNFPDGAVYPSPELDRKQLFDVESYVSLKHLRNVTPERRAGIAIYTGHFPFVATQMVGCDPIKLTLLRDPVSRTASVLRHFKRLFERYSSMPLAAIYDDPFVFPLFIQNHQTKLFALTLEDGPEAFVSNLSYWAMVVALGGTPVELDEGGELAAAAAAAEATEIAREGMVARVSASTIAIDADRLALAKANLERVDVIGLSDQYGEFIEELRARFGWWPDGLSTQGRANVSSEGWEIDASLRRRIIADNEPELELYAHAEQLVARRRREAAS